MVESNIYLSTVLKYKFEVLVLEYFYFLHNEASGALCVCVCVCVFVHQCANLKFSSGVELPWTPLPDFHSIILLPFSLLVCWKLALVLMHLEMNGSPRSLDNKVCLPLLCRLLTITVKFNCYTSPCCMSKTHYFIGCLVFIQTEIKPAVGKKICTMKYKIFGFSLDRLIEIDGSEFLNCCVIYSHKLFVFGLKRPLELYRV